jgi:predicted anti-sigma-YlaC factor YlaD
MSQPTTCKHTYRFICENLDQDTDSPRCRAIKKHLESCPECRTYLTSLKKTVQIYKLLPTPRVPREVHRNLFRHLACLEPAPRSRSIRRGVRTRARKQGRLRTRHKA